MGDTTGGPRAVAAWLAKGSRSSQVPLPRFVVPPDEFSQVRWGLIPSWSKQAGVGDKMINARSETVADKPAFQDAFRTRRCLIPADGFYEWVRSNKATQPFHFGLTDDSLFAFAGMCLGVGRFAQHNGVLWGDRASAMSSIQSFIRVGPAFKVEDWYVRSGERCHLLSMISFELRNRTHE